MTQDRDGRTDTTVIDTRKKGAYSATRTLVSLICRDAVQGCTLDLYDHDRRGGCSMEDVGGPAIEGEPAFAMVKGDELARIQAVYGGEADFVEMAAEEPSFAGYFLEDGGLIGLTADEERRDAVGEVINRHRGEPSEGVPLPPVREVRVVERSFLDLARYRNLLHTRMGQIPDFEWLDLDEVQNRVSVKVSSSEGEVAAWSIAEEFDIPAGALDVFVGPRIQTSASRTRPARRMLSGYLDQSRIRPVMGGIETISEGSEYNDQQSTWQHTCTYGFNALFAGELVFFTNSHCTREMYKDDTSPSPFYQDEPFGWPGLEVGSEHEDPNGWDCSGLSDDPCRYSDAAAILLSVDEDSIGLGKIARTLSRATDDNMGSKTIDSSNPTFEVFGKDSYPSSGQEVNVMGKTGGWRYGDVNQTCATYHPRPDGDDYLGNENDHFVVCNYRAEYHSWGGDSGAPVFIISPQGNGVYITGLNWGAEGCFPLFPCPHSQGLFSPMGGIDADFVGDIGVTTAALQPHASITGPTTAAKWTYCTYDAHASGGTPPYSYQWSGLASGTASSIGFVVMQSGTLYLQVTDANLETDHANISLTLDSSSQSCPL